ncbi:NlpC/P60 family protein [Gracilibacillus sp. S3-1-1]|uniref:NlpC/P60 family protein n=1 Tax=Gracilibacillus pellucidus TaxID=3095368 RepID=A0ACC6M5Q4_9BACI|nr:NlpC/P60 family protein [Gracilibacillus sp. S3-1-1]MDX8046172.1 NlpC/P60 family protein [Gracilibacillus sp. S3-1-1]
MLLEDQLTRVVKHSVAYGFAFSQPFSFYVDVYPLMQNEILEQSDMLEFGMQHESVSMLQHKLQKLSYYDTSVDGEFGILTEYALKKFQKEHLLEETGKADKETVKTIIDREESYHEKILKEQELDFSLGDTGEDIKKVQEALFYYGYYRAEIDGIFGGKSEKALQAYKQDIGVEIHHIETEVQQVTVETPEVEVEVAATEMENTVEEVHELEEQEIQAESSQPENKPNEEEKNAEQTNTDLSTNQIISSAQSHIGVPYVWGGTTTSGFDCSGYLQYVFQELGVSLPRTVSEIWNATIPIDQPSVGDLVFFETYKPGPSHAGIYLGDGKFIHAGASNGVEITELSVSYWSERYLGAKRVSLK